MKPLSFGALMGPVADRLSRTPNEYFMWPRLKRISTLEVATTNTSDEQKKWLRCSVFQVCRCFGLPISLFCTCKMAGPSINCACNGKTSKSIGLSLGSPSRSNDNNVECTFVQGLSTYFNNLTTCIRRWRLGLSAFIVLLHSHCMSIDTFLIFSTYDWIWCLSLTLYVHLLSSSRSKGSICSIVARHCSIVCCPVIQIINENPACLNGIFVHIWPFCALPNDFRKKIAKFPSIFTAIYLP